MAITKYDQFDFLIDIVPRDDIKPNKIRDDGTRPSTNNDQVNKLLLYLSMKVFPNYLFFLAAGSLLFPISSTTSCKSSAE